MLPITLPMKQTWRHAQCTQHAIAKESRHSVEKSHASRDLLLLLLLWLRQVMRMTDNSSTIVDVGCNITIHCTIGLHYNNYQFINQTTFSISPYVSSTSEALDDGN